MALEFTPGMTTAAQKASDYSRLLSQGYSDADIKAAADKQFGTQSASDWGYLQNLAQKNAPAAGIAPAPTGPITTMEEFKLRGMPDLPATLPPYASANTPAAGQPARTEADWNNFAAMAQFAPGTDMAKEKANFLAGGQGVSSAPTAINTTPFSGTGTGSSMGLPAYSQTAQQQGVAGYAQPYVGAMLGATMGQLFNRDASGGITGLRGYTPYSYNPSDYYAAFTPLQQKAFQGASQMQTPEQYRMGTQAANAGILSALGAGNRYGQMATDPYAAAAFMSPYYQNVVDTQMQQAKRQANIAGQAQQAQAAKAGAFGGARDLIQRQQANAELQRNLQNIQATGTQSAYQQAMQNMQNMANLGLQGAQAGITGASTLGNLGTAQQAAQQGILGLQNQFGQQQQQQQQNIINQAVQNYQTAQQYPYMQLGFMQNMLQGLPIQTSATQQYQAPPSNIAQLASLGTGLYGLNTMTGGALASGVKDLFGSVFGAAEGGSTKDIQKRKPQGLAALALSKM